jgi:hypothetical protein
MKKVIILTIFLMLGIWCFGQGIVSNAYTLDIKADDMSIKRNYGSNEITFSKFPTGEKKVLVYNGDTWLPNTDSLKISKYDLIMLASFSSDNKEVIKDKYPHLFKEAQDLTQLRQTSGFMWAIPLGFVTFMIERSQSGAFRNKGFRLNDNWDWQLERDEFKQLILVPYKK